MAASERTLRWDRTTHLRLETASDGKDQGDRAIGSANTDFLGRVGIESTTVQSALQIDSSGINSRAGNV
jgi:hypothetical protein